ncbi:MAG: hypothetical protein JXR94_00670 [Candidatus Hydrogenedentes bacterium]|nr:hypothetical protein [Candidatus Hydrogenedentota bacterium]
MKRGRWRRLFARLAVTSGVVTALMPLSSCVPAAADDVYGTDTGCCECVDESSHFPGGSSTHMGTAPVDVVIQPPQQVCIGA